MADINPPQITIPGVDYNVDTQGNRTIANSAFNQNAINGGNQPGFLDSVTSALGYGETEFQKYMKTPAYQGLGESAKVDAQKAENLRLQNEKAGSFDTAGAINTGLSAFNTFNNWETSQANRNLLNTQVGVLEAEKDRVSAFNKGMAGNAVKAQARLDAQTQARPAQ